MSKKKQRRLTPAQAQRRLQAVLDELMILGSAYDLTNGQIRLRIRRLKRRLKELLARFPTD